MDQTFTIGVSYETAPVAVCERLTYAESELVGALARLKEQSPSISEAALLSTCNRVELIAVGADIDQASFLNGRLVRERWQRRTLSFRCLNSTENRSLA
jgi:glutamyl-tRNA reductase